MPNPICHFEIGGRDVQKSREFYAKMFDWTFSDHGPSVQIKTGGPAGNEIGGHLNSLGHEPENYVTFYVYVDDVQKALDDAAEAGGRAIVGPVDIEFGIFGWFADPDGNVIGVYRDK